MNRQSAPAELETVELSNSRSMMTKLAGWLAAVFAVILLAFAVFLLVVQAPLRDCIILGGTAIFPAIVAVACLMPSQRTLALRVIGGVVCIACLATLITTFVAPGKDDPEWGRRGRFLAAAIAGAAMAIKGKWPGANE